MPGLMPGIHVLESQQAKDVDGRNKPGDDEGVAFQDAINCASDQRAPAA
jgi:hypothetical protein